MSTTAQQLYDNHLTEILNGEQISTAFALSLFNISKNRRETERPWRFLLKEDSSKTANAGDTFTSTKALPTDFSSNYKLFLGDDFRESLEIPFEERRRYQQVSRRYYIDIGNSVFALTGSISSTQTIYLLYFMFTADLATLSDSFSTRWPDRFIPLIAYDAAAIFRGGTDFDSVNARMSAENRLEARTLYDSMIAWDNRLKMQTMRWEARPPSSEIVDGARLPKQVNIL